MTGSPTILADGAGPFARSGQPPCLSWRVGRDRRRPPRARDVRAIDALGIPAMLRADAVITSSDPLTGEPVTVTFRAATASWDPSGAVVFDGYTGCDGPAEQVSCGYLNFFAALASAGKWAGQHPEVNGRALDHAHAQALAAHTFGSLLSDGT
jgi:hypothetical protein